ncbi:SCO3374 family protein [Streptomyces sp. NPDC047002]|uniref:SCO3374 family protein n=1 Tax=Streptomyces sp. NPDC047002 TaxID=3155475 RepID=UPI00345529D0
MATILPGPRGPLPHGPAQGRAQDPARGPGADAAATPERIAAYYAEVLGWPVVRGGHRGGVALATGVAFDALELPAQAGRTVVDRLDRLRGPGSDAPARPVSGPVAISADRARMWLLLAPGSADEVPGLLDWLEWGGIDLDLDALGAGRSLPAPLPPRWPVRAAQGAAVWLRPPGPARCTPSGLPTLRLCGGTGAVETGTGGSGGDAPDLVRLLDAAAAECHRVRLARGLARGIAAGAGANRQPLAFS